MNILNNINFKYDSSNSGKSVVSKKSHSIDNNRFAGENLNHSNSMIYSQFAICPKNINFTSNVSNGSFLRGLTGVHDPYSGVVILNNKEINKIYQDLSKRITGKEKVQYLSNYTESMLPVERNVYEIIRNDINENNRLSMQEVLKSKQQNALNNLIVEQQNIFSKIADLSKTLSPENRLKVSKILNYAETQVKLPHEDKNHFKNSRFECEMMRVAQDKTFNQLEEHLQKLPIEQKDKAFERLNEVKQIFQTTPYYTNIKGKTPLKMVHELQKDYAPETLKLDNEMQPIIELAQSLPTTKNNENAFIVQMADNDDKTIAKRLISESLGTIEHVVPDSKGGANEAYNFLFVTKSRNEERGNRSINKFKKMHPDIPNYCQQYLDDVIRNCENGKIRGFEWYPFLIKDTLKNEIGTNVAIKSYRMSPQKAFRCFPERLKPLYPQYEKYFNNK